MPGVFLAAFAVCSDCTCGSHRILPVPITCVLRKTLFPKHPIYRKTLINDCQYSGLEIVVVTSQSTSLMVLFVAVEQFLLYLDVVQDVLSSNFVGVFFIVVLVAAGDVSM
eukprot:1717377-Amphidinium_carterae.2